MRLFDNRPRLRVSDNGPHLRATLLLACLAQFMVILDVSVIAAAFAAAGAVVALVGLPRVLLRGVRGRVVAAEGT